MIQNNFSHDHIANIEVFRKKFALTQPYKLSFGALHFFDTFISHVTLKSGSEGFGETVPLPGYGWENGDSVEKFLSLKKREYIDQPITEVLTDLYNQRTKNPFAATAIHTALETANNGRLSVPVPCSIPAVVLLDHTSDALSELINKFRKAGFKTLKVKLGTQDPDEDIHLLANLKKENLNGILLRFDANQAFTFDEALQIGRAMEGLPVEFFEQPLPKNDWEAQKELTQELKVRTMLDEAIWSADDVMRVSKEKSAQAIKLKLMKCGSMKNLIDMATLAQKKGLDVVLGNGVAGPINCVHEAILHQRLGLTTAGEMNGFSKLEDPFLPELLQLKEGCIVLLKNHVSKRYMPKHLLSM